eukprot:maker-scaffold_39-snap-gene-1.2-mRNA-1 protein AED:0.03 eAED:0.04 QI:0/0/0/1/0.33/0.25/4/0/1866
MQSNNGLVQYLNKELEAEVELSLDENFVNHAEGLGESRNVTQKEDVDENVSHHSRNSTILSALLWKNWLLKKRQWKTSCLEILVPIVFVALLAYLKSFSVAVKVETGWSTDRAKECPYTNQTAQGDYAYVACNLPYNAFSRRVTPFKRIEALLSIPNSSFFLTFNTEREKEAAQEFVSWASQVGTAESGPIVGFEDMVTFWGDGSIHDLVAYAKSSEYGNPFSAETPEIAMALSFNVMDFEKANFDYTIRMNSSASNSNLKVPNSGAPAVNPLQRRIKFKSGSPGATYLQKGFVTLQLFVDSFIIHNSGTRLNFNNSDDTPSKTGLSGPREVFEPGRVNAVAFPVSQYSQDLFYITISSVLPLVFCLMFLFPASQISAALVLEKEVRSREMLRLMGVSNFNLVLSWYMTYAIYFLVLSITFAVFGMVIFPATSVNGGGLSLILVLCFFLFGMATTSLSFLISTFFRTSFNGAVASLMVFLLLFFIFYAFDGSTGEISGSPPSVILLIPQVSFSFIIKTLAAFEVSAVGVSWEHIDVSVDGFSVLDGFQFLMFDCIYLTLLGFYFNAVIPSEFGYHLPFYFPVQKSFYQGAFNKYLVRKIKVSAFGKGNCKDEDAIAENEFSCTDAFQSKFVEEVEYNLKEQARNKVGIQIRNLTKQFNTPGGVKVAVKNFSLDVFEGQILVLLGHNGCGKSTLLNLLCGSLMPSGGDAMVYGDLITQDIQTIRKRLGFCPQKNILYPLLTVKEHLRLYGKLRGLAGRDLNSSVISSVQCVGLSRELNTYSKNLSGGMKRRLSLAISLLGESKVIFIDEPTAGVDPFSRRSIWHAIQNCRKGRVIILTTHFMDEADILADRLAIMSEGELQCCGSSLYLKHLYGAGYQLTCTKVDSVKLEANTQDVKNIVLSSITGSSVSSEIGMELNFFLPLNKTSCFPFLFRKLDKLIVQKEVNILSYGISVMNLEHVFLNAGQSQDLLKGSKELGKEESISKFSSLKRQVSADVKAITKSESPFSKNSVANFLDFTAVLNSLFLQQLYALFFKRVNYAKRDSHSFLCNTLVPVTIFAIGLLILKIVPHLEDDPSEICSVKPKVRYGYTLFVNTTARHAVPIGIKEMNTALLRASLVNASTKNLNPMIQVNSHPLPRTTQSRQIYQVFVAFISSVFAVLAFSFIPGPAIAYLVMERESTVQIKHLQFVSGAGISAYWVSTYAFDLLIFLLPCVLEVETLIKHGAFEVLVVTILGYGWAILPFSYLLSNWFTERTRALIGIVIVNCLTGAILMVASYAMDQIATTSKLNSSLKPFYKLFPGFCLGETLLLLSSDNLVQGIFPTSKNASNSYYFNLAGTNLVYLYTEGLIMFLLVILLEYSKSKAVNMQKLKSLFFPGLSDINSAFLGLYSADTPCVEHIRLVDDDVMTEERLVSSNVMIDKEVVRMQHLRKVYPNGKIALKSISLSIKAGTCFGYLGINGAGKTTTLKCLTGDIAPTSGTASIEGYDICTAQSTVRKRIGYCSQFDSILGYLTVKEHLQLFCRIKYDQLSLANNSSFSGDLVEGNVQILLERLSLKPFEHALARSLSGGNKRKMSVAIAMIGSPSVMLLDEPSTGMDVASRRYMWDVILDMVSGKYGGKKTSVILTTHSMEECEALCSRVGIMVSGGLKCLGGIQHLKSKFGKGLTIEAKFKKYDKRDVVDCLAQISLYTDLKGEIPLEKLHKVCDILGVSSVYPILANNENGRAQTVVDKLQECATISENIFSIDASHFLYWIWQQQRLEEVLDFLKKSSTNAKAELIEFHGFQAVFKLSRDDAGSGIADVFDLCEKNKERFNISEYSISQTTLEQIFNMFARKEEETTVNNISNSTLTEGQKAVQDLLLSHMKL